MKTFTGARDDQTSSLINDVLWPQCESLNTNGISKVREIESHAVCAIRCADKSTALINIYKTDHCEYDFQCTV